MNKQNNGWLDHFNSLPTFNREVAEELFAKRREAKHDILQEIQQNTREFDEMPNPSKNE